MKIYLLSGKAILADKLSMVLLNASATDQQFEFECEIWATGEIVHFPIEDFDYAIDAQSEDNQRNSD